MKTCPTEGIKPTSRKIVAEGHREGSRQSLFWSNGSTKELSYSLISCIHQKSKAKFRNRAINLTIPKPFLPSLSTQNTPFHHRQKSCRLKSTRRSQNGDPNHQCTKMSLTSVISCICHSKFRAARSLTTIMHCDPSFKTASARSLLGFLMI